MKAGSGDAGANGDHQQPLLDEPGSGHIHKDGIHYEC